MTEPTWETIETPRGAYIGWGDDVGQHVTGRVVDYQPLGGTDANENPCPQLSLELTDKAASFSRKNGWSEYPAGDLVVINAGLVSLKRGLKAAQPEPGDLIKITLSNLVPSKNGTVKEMEIRIARGAGAQPARQTSSAPSFGGQQPPQQPTQAAPPF